MLSVCIPIFNFDVRDTVRRLAAQAAEYDGDIEIVCIDDASDEHFRNINTQVSSLAKFVNLEHNIGRSRIRNLFLQHTEGRYLLFIDCDSLIPDDRYLQRYMQILAQSETDVVCGGRIYPPSADRRHRLRHRYGIKRECHDAQTRSRNPYASFMTNNFVVARDILEAIPFDENLSRYGHEDTLFGICLGQKRVDIKHIDNPVLNGDIEENSVFLSKTRDGVLNLALIYKTAGLQKELEESVSLINFYNKLKRKHLLPLLNFSSKIALLPIERCLTAGIVSIKMFSFYKLGLFAKQFSQQSA